MFNLLEANIFLIKGGGQMLTLVQPEKDYTSDELAKKLGVATATLRKYNFYFSKVGVHFKKEKGKLIYTEEDLKLFRKLIKMKETSGVSLETCVAELSKDLKTVVGVSDFVSDVVPTTTTPSQQPQQQDIHEKLIHQMEEHSKQIKEMKEYIDTRLDKRDKQMMEVVRQLQEMKTEHNRRGFLNWLKRIFGKNK